jgi:hypothetical protein
MKSKKNTTSIRGYNNDKNENLLENVNAIDKEQIELTMKDLDSKIEELGKIVDSKVQKSYDEFNSVLKQKKTQHQDELTKLNFKLIEAIKQNTREDFLTKLKNDLKTIQNQVYDKDKQLQSM